MLCLHPTASLSLTIYSCVFYYLYTLFLILSSYIYNIDDLRAFPYSGLGCYVSKKQYVFKHSHLSIFHLYVVVILLIMGFEQFNGFKAGKTRFLVNPLMQKLMLLVRTHSFSANLLKFLLIHHMYLIVLLLH